MSLREEDRQKNSCPSRGLGLAAAAIGVGVGAALYYFFNKRTENPTGEGSTSTDWHTHTLQHSEEYNSDDQQNDSFDNSHIHVSDHSTTDTSLNSLHSETHNNSSSQSDEMTSSNESTEISSISFESYSENEDSNDNSTSIDAASDNVITNLTDDMELDDMELDDMELDDMELSNSDTESLESDFSEDSLESISEDLLEGIREETNMITNDFSPSSFEYSFVIGNLNRESSVIDDSIEILEWNHDSNVQGAWYSGSGETRHGTWAQFSVRFNYPNRHKQRTEEEQARLLRERAFRDRTWSLEECSICFEIMLKDQQLTTLPCTHHFHSDCIAPWLQEQQTCPNCRKAAE